MDTHSSFRRQVTAFLRSLLPDFGRADEEFLQKYRVMLFGQYASLGESDLQKPAQVVAKEVVAKGENVTWEDLYKLEAALIMLEPDDALRRRAWIIRNEYQSVATADEYKDYVASNPPSPENGDIGALRADLIRLQEELHWRYLVTWIFEEYRGSLTKVVCRIAGVVMVLVFVFSCWLYHLLPPCLDLNYSLIFTVMSAGLIGGLTSTLRRIQQARFNGNADLDLAQLLQGSTSVYISPILGAVFAFILFLLFASKLAEGGVFPRLSFDMVFTYGAVDFDGTEFAKLLVWSFVSGFAEAFVPDKLSRLAADNEAATPKQ